MFIHRHVDFFAHLLKNGKQFFRFFHIAVLTLVGKVPLDKIEISFGAKKAP